MKTWIRGVAPRAALVAALLTAPGCAGVGLGTLEDVLGGMGGLGGDAVRGEVGWIDERRQEIGVETRRGRETLRYDSRTEVIYRQQRYSVRDLERGDLISARVQRDSRGEPYVDRIEVEQSVRERSGGGGGGWESTGQVQRFEGRVTWIDYDRGQFEIESQYGGALTITLPYNPGNAITDRFRRLRRGDHVRLEGETLNQRRVELRRFL